MKAKDLATWATILGGAYVLYKLYNAASAVPKAISTALTSTGEAIGGTLYDWIHPDTAGESLFYVTLFMDGAKHAIPSQSVNAAGQFAYNGVRYQMKSSDTAPHVAVPA